MNIQEFHHKLMEFDILHPQLSISYATPGQDARGGMEGRIDVKVEIVM